MFLLLLVIMRLSRWVERNVREGLKYRVFLAGEELPVVGSLALVMVSKRLAASMIRGRGVVWRAPSILCPAALI